MKNKFTKINMARSMWRNSLRIIHEYVELKEYPKKPFPRVLYYAHWWLQRMNLKYKNRY